MTHYTDHIGKTAWLFLIHEVKQIPAGNLSVDKLHQKVDSWMTNGTIGTITGTENCLWEFVNDIIDAVFDDIRDDDTDEVNFRLGSDSRHRKAYQVFKGYLLEDSIRVGKKMKREVNSKAKQAGVNPAHAQDLIRAIVPEMLELALD